MTNELLERDAAEVNTDAVSRLPDNLAIMKMENDNIMALAAARPRDHKKIKQELLAQLEAYPSFAKAVMYCKPVGKGDDGKMKFARGLSVRAAEALAEAYGYNRVRSDVTIIDPDNVKIEASFTDYQRGRIWQDSGILSKWYKAAAKFGGKMTRHPDDRFFNVLVKAEASKRIREVIVRSVPPGLRSELEEMAERVIDTLLDDATINKIVAHFSTKGVTLEQLEEHIGRTLANGWTKEDRSNLLGLWNGIKDGEISVGETFNGKADEPKSDPKLVKELQDSIEATAGAMIEPREVKELPTPESEGQAAPTTPAPDVPAPETPQTLPETLEPEKRGRGRPKKQNAADAAAGPASTTPAPDGMYPREPGIEEDGN